MRTRRFVSAVRTPGRMYRNARRHFKRMEAAGKPIESRPSLANAKDTCELLKRMYTHIKTGALKPGQTPGHYMNRIMSPLDRECRALARASMK